MTTIKGTKGSNSNSTAAKLLLWPCRSCIGSKMLDVVTMAPSIHRSGSVTVGPPTPSIVINVVSTTAQKLLGWIRQLDTNITIPVSSIKRDQIVNAMSRRLAVKVLIHLIGRRRRQPRITKVCLLSARCDCWRAYSPP